MSLPLKTAFWYALTGRPTMDILENNGKIYIPIDCAVNVVTSFRFKLLRLGLDKLTGLSPQGIIELLEVLEQHFKELKKLKKLKQEASPTEKEP